jgi:hypothetical protein
MAKCGQYAGIAVTPAELRFEAVEGWKYITLSQYISLRRAGPGRAAHWEAQTEPEKGWLRAYPSVGLVGERIKVNCETKNLAPGVYVGAVVIESIVATDNPRISVILTVTPKQPPTPEPPDPDPDPVPPEYIPPSEDPEDEPEDEPEEEEPVETNWFWRFIQWLLGRL